VCRPFHSRFNDAMPEPSCNKLGAQTFGLFSRTNLKITPVSSLKSIVDRSRPVQFFADMHGFARRHGIAREPIRVSWVVESHTVRIHLRFTGFVCAWRRGGQAHVYFLWSILMCALCCGQGHACRRPSGRGGSHRCRRKARGFKSPCWEYLSDRKHPAKHPFSVRVCVVTLQIVFTRCCLCH
jgi:hypothetical protein